MPRVRPFTQMQPNRLERLRSTCENSTWTCFPSPVTNFMRQRASGLYLKRDTPLVPFVLGAGHERGLRPGTENVAAIVGLGAACAVAQRDLAAFAVRVAALRDDLWQRLESAVPGVRLNGHATRRLPNTLNVRFPRASGNAILSATPEIAASTGSACHAGGETASAVILAMGVAPDEAVGSIRLTLGRATTAADLATAADALVRSWRSVARS